MNNQPLKLLTARSLKWNVIDRVASQVLYAITGIVLARELSHEAFGLVGAIMVFQAFALLFVDSGFSYALIQRHRPSQQDYSSVFWFNLLMACAIYCLLWLCAPLIADCFGGDERLIPLSRVMFLSFIINALAIVQTNRLMKQMNVKPIAMTNALALIIGGAVGIVMAQQGYGAWSLVWQTIAINAVKTIALWIYCRWLPSLSISWTALRSFFGVGGSMMMTSFLNTLFQNIYSLVIGNRVGMVPLGYYTQADKWSKLGITSVTQVLTSSFLPALSEVQNDDERFRRVALKMNRFTCYLLYPALGFLAVMATPIFHVLFGVKWDASIVLFQLLLLRGVFTILNTLYNNYILALGRSRAIFRLEVLRDVVAAVGIVVTLPWINLQTPGHIVAGLELLLIGQVVASAVTWVVTLITTSRLTAIPATMLLRDMLPYLCSTIAIMAILWAIGLCRLDAWLTLTLQAVAALALYLGVNAIFPSKIQRELFAYIRPHKAQSTND
jgi:O-antigen/teichoic acid export membrane protein